MLTCEKLIDSKRFYSQRFFMVSTCSDWTNATVVKQCTKPDRKLPPVRGSDYYLYKNSFCALCNSVSNYSSSNVKLRCLLDGVKVDCDASIDKADRLDRTFMRCEPTCHGCLHIKSGLDFVCEKRLDGLTAFYDLYKRTCHGFEPNDPFLGLHTMKDLFPNNGVMLFLSVMSFHSDGMIKDYNHEGLVMTITLDVICKDIDSLHKDNCLQARCSSIRFKMVGSRCVRLLPGATKFMPLQSRCLLLAQEPSLFFVSNYNSIISNDARKQIMNILGVDMTNVTMYHHDNESAVYKIHQNISVTFLHELDNKYADAIKFQLMRNNDELVLSASEQPLLSTLHNLSFQNTFSHQRICYEQETYTSLAKFHIGPNCNLSYVNTKQYLSDVLFWTSYGNEERHQYVTTCNRFYFTGTCSGTPEIISNMKINESGNLDFMDTTYTVEQYTPLKNSALICRTTPDPKSTKVNGMFQRIERYLTFGGAILNTCCYIMFITTFCILKQLQTVPGLCTLTLVVFLLITDSMYLFAALLSIYDGVLPLCKTIAVIVHVGLVMTQFWCTTIAYDLMSSFTNYSLIPASKKPHRFRFYCIFTNVVTSIIVLVAFLLDKFNCVLTGYGSNRICMPHEFYGRLFFYIIPTIVSFACSIIFIIIAISNLHTENKKDKRVLKHSGRKNMNVLLFALKVILIVGISEGIGFIQIVGSNQSDSDLIFDDIFALVYSLVRSLRGAILLVVFVSKRDVLRVYEKRMLRTASSITPDEL